MEQLFSGDLDIGLLCAMAKIDSTSILEENELFIEFKGSQAEQWVEILKM